MIIFKILIRYGFFGSFRLFFDWLHTRLFFFDSRLVRRPVYIRGKSYILFGRGLTTGVGLRIDISPTAERGRAVLEIGDNVQINDYVHIGAIQSVRIDSDVLIASKVIITDHNHGYYGSDSDNDHPDSAPAGRKLHSKPVVIESCVWIGESVAVLPGSHIGKGSVIGANSVVNGVIPPNSIAVGVPAKVIKRFDADLKQWIIVT